MTLICTRQDTDIANITGMDTNQAILSTTEKNEFLPIMFPKIPEIRKNVKTSKRYHIL